MCNNNMCGGNFCWINNGICGGTVNNNGGCGCC